MRLGYACLVMAAFMLQACATAGTAKYRDCPECPQMVEIPVFPITNSADVDSAPSVVASLAVSETPITFREWRSCVHDGGCDGYMPDMQGWSDDTPAVNVSYDDAQNYIAWLTNRAGKPYRLIREDEWAYLALGGAATSYPWGNKLDRAQTNCLDCGSQWDGKRASPVKSFAPNKFGLFDMIGNVAHWTEDPSIAATLSRRKCESRMTYRAIFGASWADPSKYLATNEWACFPHILRDDTIGFRVVSEHVSNAPVN